MQWIAEAVKAGRTALNEYEAKRFLEDFGIPVSREMCVSDGEEAVKAAVKIGYPVVLKAAGEHLQHKTDVGAVALNLKSKEEVREEAQRLIAITGCECLLVQEMVKGDRELVCGLTRDPQFGPCVMFGLGGIFTELINDVVFRVAPLTKTDALDMMEEIRTAKILQAFRGQQPVNRDALAQIILAVGEIGVQYENVREIDINPIKVRKDGSLVAVDALVTIQLQPQSVGEMRQFPRNRPVSCGEL
jgi:succinyl-CoA synthetase beta subunit